MRPIQLAKSVDKCSSIGQAFHRDHTAGQQPQTPPARASGQILGLHRQPLLQCLT